MTCYSFAPDDPHARDPRMALGLGPKLWKYRYFRGSSCWVECVPPRGPQNGLNPAPVGPGWASAAEKGRKGPRRSIRESSIRSPGLGLCCVCSTDVGSNPLSGMLLLAKLACTS